MARNSRTDIIAEVLQQTRKGHIAWRKSSTIGIQDIYYAEVTATGNAPLRLTLTSSLGGCDLLIEDADTGSTKLQIDSLFGGLGTDGRNMLSELHSEVERGAGRGEAEILEALKQL